MPEPTTSPHRFHPEMPSIPGLDKHRPARGSAFPIPVSQIILILLSLAVLAALGGFGWWHLRTSLGKAHSSASAEEVLPVAPAASPIVKPAAAPVAGPVTIATVEELEKPWSAKKFTFVKPDTLATVPAIVVRLPDIPGDESSAYWAFSLAAPFGSCNLDYLTDLNVLATRYSYSASHPMVATPCDGTLFDPLRMEMTPAGAWVRGEVQQGPGIRPPISIRVQVKGGSLIADRME
jgi:hypothetical protein